jgi:predicted phosphodiesterase
MLRLLLAALLAIGGIGLGLRLAGPVERETALGGVSLRVAPSVHGTVDAFIPLANWGVRAKAFRTPLTVHVEPRTVDRQAVIRASGGDSGVLAAAKRDAQHAARDALLRAWAWAVGGALAIALAAAGVVRWARGRSWRIAAAWAGAVVALAAAIGGLALVRADRTFDAQAFETPRFYARGAELAQLLKVVEKAQAGGNPYTSQVDRTLSGYAALLQAGGTAGLAAPGRRAVLVSDLHANTLVLDAVKRLATGSPVFFAGDFGQAGTDDEAGLLVDRVTDLGQIVAVSGNHDSRRFMRRLAAAGAIVLTETGRLDGDGTTDGKPVEEVAGLRVAGYSDPLESRTGDPDDPQRIFSFSERPDGDQEFLAAQARVLEWFRALTTRPDVILIHQNGLAQALGAALREEGGPQLLILTGHDHRQHVDRYGQTVVVDAGTVGAGGLLGAGKAPIGIAQLELGDAAWPRVIDLVQVEPLSGGAQADRVLLGAPDVCTIGTVRCHDADEGAVDDPGDPPEEAG